MTKQIIARMVWRKRLMMVICCCLISITTYSQTDLRIHRSNGTHTDVPISDIDSITLVNYTEPTTTENLLIGSWLWGSAEMGYYEVLTFNEDKSYMGYDNYFTYGFDTETYGWYFQVGSILTLQSNGYGYQRVFRWYVTSLTHNALEVMTKMGQFTYYRLQSEPIHLQISAPPLACTEEESLLFADGVFVQINDNHLKGLIPGVSYILKYQSATNTVLAYQVIVEP